MIMTGTKEASVVTSTRVKSCCRRIMLIKRKGRKYGWNRAAGFGVLRHNTKGSRNFFCKAIVLLIILEGFGSGSGEETITTSSSEGSSSAFTGSNSGGAGDGWQSNQYQQQSTFGGGGGENGNDDNRGGGGDSFMAALTSSRAEAARRMRDRCGRYSLLKVLQQWENMQRRCRLSVRTFLNGNGNVDPTLSYQQPYKEDPADGYDWIAPTTETPSEQLDELAENQKRNVEKRSRHHYYNPFTSIRVNNNDDDDVNYYYEVNGDALESCCPVVFEVVAPIYGRNRSGHMVELYRDDKVQQKFNEYRCQKDYLERPCRFVDNEYRRISRCVQQFSDTYALVKSDDSKTGWSMEHIRVGSGCACKVDPASKRRKKISSAQRSLRRSQKQVQDRVAGLKEQASKWYDFERRNSKRYYPQMSDY